MSHSPLFRKFLHTLQQARRDNLAATGQPLPLPNKQRHWTRRRLIKTAALATGTALVTRLQPAWSGDNPRIAIIGAGLAGLNAAFQLKQAGITATVYEARNRLGGRVQSITNAFNANLVADLGGSFINSDHTDMLALARRFRLKLFNRLSDAKKFPFPEVGYFFDGRIRAETDVATSLRPLAQQIAEDAKLLDRNFDRFAPIFDRLSVTDYLNQHTDKIPEPFIRVLIEHTIRTEYGVEPSEASTLLLLFNLPTVNGQAVELLGNSDEAFVVEGGSARIVQSLATELSGQIQRQSRLLRLQANGDGFRLTFNGNRIVDADYVILAIPFTVLKQVDLQVNLPRPLRRFINQSRLGTNEKVIANVTQKSWRRPDGFVTEIWADGGFSEAWDETQRQTNRQQGALTFYLGGAQVTSYQQQGRVSLGRQFIAFLNTALPGLSSVSSDRFIGTDWTQDPFTNGAYSTFRPGQLTEFGDFFYIESDNPAERQDVNVGNLIFAGEHLSDEFIGYMNGAAQTGRLAAEIILRNMD